jgi:predicted Fe-Mo cluster-binding NifX family protein
MLARVEGGSFESGPIQAAPGHECGALPGIFAKEGVKTVIVGGIGMGAIQHLRSAGINVVSGASGTAEEVLSSFVKGELQSQDAVCPGEHGASGGCGHHG